jgi:hypothetical protein
MISVEQCRRILGEGCRASDNELERLREQLYALADIATSAYLERFQYAPIHSQHAGTERSMISKKMKGTEQSAANNLDHE